MEDVSQRMAEFLNSKLYGECDERVVTTTTKDDLTITVLECTCGSRTVEICQEGVEDILVLNGEYLDLIVNLYMNWIDG